MNCIYNGHLEYHHDYPYGQTIQESQYYAKQIKYYVYSFHLSDYYCSFDANYFQFYFSFLYVDKKLLGNGFKAVSSTAALE